MMKLPAHITKEEISNEMISADPKVLFSSFQCVSQSAKAFEGYIRLLGLRRLEGVGNSFQMDLYSVVGGPLQVSEEEGANIGILYHWVFLKCRREGTIIKFIKFFIFIRIATAKD